MTAPLPPAAEECTRCGACCLSHQAHYIRVFEADLARMDEATRALTEQQDGIRSMRFVNGRCSALLIDRQAGTLRCAIYAMRPDACRWLQQGSTPCREQIRDKRPRALVLLDSNVPS